MTSHLQYHGISLSHSIFEAGASDFVSHTFDLNTCCMYRNIQVVRAIEAQVYISNSHYYSSVVACTNCSKAFSLNQPECSTLSLSCQPSPSLQSSLHLILHLSVQCMHKCVCECDDLYQALQCECDDLFQALQTNIRTSRSNRTSPVRRLFASRFGARQLFHSLAGNNIEDEGAKSLSGALRGMSKLQRLRLVDLHTATLM